MQILQSGHMFLSQFQVYILLNAICMFYMMPWLMLLNVSSQSQSIFVQVYFNKMFWSKPCSLALAQDSPLRVEEPKYEGIRHIIFKMLLFYSKQSKSIRGANVVYRRIASQVDKPAIYNGEFFLTAFLLGKKA